LAKYRMVNKPIANCLKTKRHTTNRSVIGKVAITKQLATSVRWCSSIRRNVQWQDVTWRNVRGRFVAVSRKFGASKKLKFESATLKLKSSFTHWQKKNDRHNWLRYATDVLKGARIVDLLPPTW